MCGLMNCSLEKYSLRSDLVYILEKVRQTSIAFISTI
jgi:hypothetical protein